MHEVKSDHLLFFYLPAHLSHQDDRIGNPVLEIGDQVEVDFFIGDVLTVCRGEIVRKRTVKGEIICRINFEDGDSLDVPYESVRPAPSLKDKELQEGMRVSKFFVL